jgi:hypothetical protein
LKANPRVLAKGPSRSKLTGHPVFEPHGIADSRFWAYGEMMPADSVATLLIHRAGGELNPAVVTN